MAFGLFCGFIASPFSGTIVDRFNRRMVLIWLNLVQCLIILAVANILPLMTNQFPVLLFVGAVNSICFTIFIPAIGGFLKEIVQKKDLIYCNSIVEVALQIAIFMAAGITGWLYKIMGIRNILILDAATFLLAAILLLRIPLKSTRVKMAAESSWDQLCKGIRFLNANKTILVFALAIQIPYVVILASNVVLPVYVKRVVQADVVVFGLAEMCYGMGALAAGLLIHKLAETWAFRPLVILLFLVSIFSLVSLYFPAHEYGLYVIYMMFGVGNSSLKVVLNTRLMEIVPGSHFGRTVALSMGVSSLLQIGAAFGIGKLMDLVSPVYGFQILAVLLVVSLIAILPTLSHDTAKAEIRSG